MRRIYKRINNFTVVKGGGAPSEEAWRQGECGEKFDNTARAGIRLSSVTAAKFAAQAVDLVYDAAGISAIQTSEDIERCWRDA